MKRWIAGLPPSLRVSISYGVLRLALFALALGIGILIGLHSFVLFVVAFVISGVASFPLARRQRETLARMASARMQRDPRGRNGQ